MKMTLAIVLGLISAILIDVIMMLVWFPTVGSNFDVTGNYLMLAVLPCALIVSLLVGLVLWKIFRADPMRYVPAFSIAWAVGYFGTLMATLNPVLFALQCAVIVLATSAVVLTLLHRPTSERA